MPREATHRPSAAVHGTGERMRARPFRHRLAAVAWLSLVAIGCGTKARVGSMKVVDPAVQKQPRWHHETIPGGYRLGPYEILAPRVRESAADERIPVTGGVYPGYRYDLELTLFVPAEKRTHDVRCTGRRQANLDADFAAIAGEQKHDMLVECDIRSAGAHWSFTAAGRLDDNIAGELVQEGDASGLPPARVEIILWAVRAKYFRRDLPYPVLQVRRGKHVVAAMIVAKDEWAWVQPSADVELREAAVATLAALRHLPLGFEE